MKLISAVRRRRMAGDIEARLAAYASDLPSQAIAQIQLELLNREWARTVKRIPFYSKLVAANAAPGEFESLEHFFAVAPMANRSLIHQHAAGMCDPSRGPDSWRITGGSTSQPVQLPAWREEFVHAQYDMWAARSWYSIDPGSRLFLLWGHSHLLGTGLKGRWNGFRRSLNDRLLQYRRFSAYNLSAERLKQAAAEMIAFRPDYFLGYSVALDSFARANEDMAGRLRALNLKVCNRHFRVVPRAGVRRSLSTPSRDRRARIGADGAIAGYGSVETNVIAHTHPSGGYRVFWRTHLVEALPVAGTRRCRVLITSLYPRCFPLVRYEMGDEIEVEDTQSPAEGVLRFRAVIGRCNDSIRWETGQPCTPRRLVMQCARNGRCEASR